MRRLLAVLAFALPAPALAYRVMQTSGYPLRWADANIPIAYRLHAAASTTGSSCGGSTACPRTAHRNEIVSAFQTWDAVSCSRIAFTQGTDLTSTSLGNDGINKVIFVNSGWPEGPGVLGVTTPIFEWNGRIIDADIRFNGEDNTWTTGSTHPNGFNNEVDTRSIALHEQGHMFGLDHPCSQSGATGCTGGAVMAATYGGDWDRVLFTDDINGVCYLYPALQDGTGVFGSGCIETRNCQSGLVCLSTPSGAKSCTRECTPGGAACPTGYTCQATTASSTGYACFDQASDSGDICKACSLNSQCTHNLCVPGYGCSKPCPDGQCPTGYQCYWLDPAQTQTGCLPNSGSCSNQCTQDSQCPSGMSCVSGTCTYNASPEGGQCNPGVCAQSLVCVGPDPDATYRCRTACTPPSGTCPTNYTCTALEGGGGACLPTSGGGTQCLANNGESCTGQPPACCKAGVCVATSSTASSGTCYQQCNPSSPNCPANHTCVTLSNGAGACWPTPTAAPECGDCLQTGTCVSGSQCYCIEGSVENCTAARCYKGCSPSQPSQCSTNYCFGDNTCACPDEVAGEGEPCGAGAGKVCPSGYQCFNSGTGAVCRQQCNPGSCPSDRVCAPVTGQNFSLCVPPAPQQDGGTGDGGGTTDGGTTDAGDGGQDSGGTADAGTADGGAGTDAGTGDTGTTDAGGQTDAGTTDGGATDGGSTDAGDAGSTDGGSGSDGGSSVVPRRGGCNCGTAGAETWLSLLGLVLLNRRRRNAL